MKRFILIFFLGEIALLPFSPTFFGARSLALGYASVAYNQETNSIYINPAMLTQLTCPTSALQYQQGYFDYSGLYNRFSDVLKHDLLRFDELNSNQRSEIIGELRDLYASPVFFYGSQVKNPAYGDQGYGSGVSFIDSAVVLPVQNDILKKSEEEITAEDLAGLELDFLGFSYTQYTFSLSMPISQEISIGASLHYMNGKVSDFTRSIVEDPVKTESTIHDYLSYAWKRDEKRLSRFNLDMGVVGSLGKFFSLGLVVKNMFDPKIETPKRTLTLKRRFIAGIAFHSHDFWGVYLDMDLYRTELLFNGKKQQMISLGVEKGFFQNQFQIRAGLVNDLTEAAFFGEKSNVFYGLGLGFNISFFKADLALSLDRFGNIKGLAVSGFFLVRGKN